MSHQFQKATELTGEVIAAAIEVHRAMGPGLVESIYEWCLTKELELRGFETSNQQTVTIHYKGFQRQEELRYDMVVEQCVIVELKAVQQLAPIHKAQLLSYMKLLDIPIGLLMNFHQEKLTDGLARLVLPGSGQLQTNSTVGS